TARPGPRGALLPSRPPAHGVRAVDGGTMAEATTRLYLEAPVEQVDTGTATLPCRRFGQGPPILLVHGFPLSGFTWRKVLPELAQRHTCWVPDLPGMGDSRWTEANDFSFPGQGRTLKALVDRLGLEHYSVVAQDTGGTFARYLALDDSGRLEKLVLSQHRDPTPPAAVDPALPAPDRAARVARVLRALAAHPAVPAVRDGF